LPDTSRPATNHGRARETQAGAPTSERLYIVRLMRHMGSTRRTCTGQWNLLSAIISHTIFSERQMHRRLTRRTWKFFSREIVSGTLDTALVLRTETRQMVPCGEAIVRRLVVTFLSGVNRDFSIGHRQCIASGERQGTTIWKRLMPAAYSLRCCVKPRSFACVHWR
jgi:hypothetical protein